MAKIIFKIGFLGVALVIYVLNIPATLALANQSAQDPPSFCERIGEYSDKIERDIDERKSRLGNKHLEITQTLRQNRELRTDKLAGIRREWAQKQTAQYDALLKKAASSREKKTAVLTFRSSINQSEQKRQNAIDNIVLVFRRELDAAIGERKSKLEQAATFLRQDIKSAFDEAKNACSAVEADNVAIKNKLRQKIALARKTFGERIAIIGSESNRRVEFSHQRKIDIDKAVSDFRSAAAGPYSQLKSQY